MPARELHRPLTRPADEAIDRAVAIAAAAGLRVTDRPRDAVTLDGPRYRSTNQPPLLAAAPLTVAAGGGRLAVRAENRGLDWMRRFVTWFPLTLTLAIAALTGGVMIAQGLPPAAAGRTVLITVAATLPGLAVIPLLMRWTRNRVEAAVVKLLDDSA